MLILLSVALLGFSLLLFGLGLAAWLIGLVIQIAIWVFQLVLLSVWTGMAFYRWIQRLEATFVRTELIKLEVSASRNVDRGAVHDDLAPPPLRGSRRVPHLTLVKTSRPETINPPV